MCIGMVEKMIIYFLLDFYNPFFSTLTQQTWQASKWTFMGVLRAKQSRGPLLAFSTFLGKKTREFIVSIW